MKAQLLLALVSTVLFHSRPALGRPIYGTDDRRDLYDVAGDDSIPKEQRDAILKLARSTAALFHKEQVRIDGADATLLTFPLSEHYPNHDASKLRYQDQPTGAFCSGALVAPDVVLTAGHCVDKVSKEPSDCAGIRFVFDFSLPDKGHDPTKVPAASVYGCTGLIILSDSLDYALVRLDRPVKDREPLGLSRTDSIKEGSGLFTIGYPYGLPAKFAGNGKVRNDNDQRNAPDADQYIFSDLDTLAGNSGSPVFNADTKLIEGVTMGVISDPRNTKDVEFIANPDGGKPQVVDRVVTADEHHAARSVKAAAFRKEVEENLVQVPKELEERRKRLEDLLKAQKAMLEANRLAETLRTLETAMKNCPPQYYPGCGSALLPR